jgi:hypothetical protein
VQEGRSCRCWWWHIRARGGRERTCARAALQTSPTPPPLARPARPSTGRLGPEDSSRSRAGHGAADRPHHASAEAGCGPRGAMRPTHCAGEETRWLVGSGLQCGGCRLRLAAWRLPAHWQACSAAAAGLLAGLRRGGNACTELTAWRSRAGRWAQRRSRSQWLWPPNRTRAVKPAAPTALPRASESLPSLWAWHVAASALPRRAHTAGPSPGRGGDRRRGGIGRAGGLRKSPQAD